MELVERGSRSAHGPSASNAEGLRAQEHDHESSSDTEAQGDSTETPDSTNDPWLVKWKGPDDLGDPLNTPTWKKWALTVVLALSAFCVAACSAVAADTYNGLQDDFGISREVAVLSVSLFVMGFDSGSLLLGPLSEFNGRARVLHMSFALFWLLQLPVALANHISIHLVFRLLTGLAGSGFLSVSGGAVSDVFRNEDVGTPLMFFSASPFLGGVAPIFAGFINQNTSWRWTYYLFIIWAFVLLCLLFAFVPETLDQELLRRKAVRLRKETGDTRWTASVERKPRSFRATLVKSISTPFWLLTTQPMILLLDLWSSLILGILYLSFGGIPYIFRTQYNFSLQDTGLVFISLGIGQCVAVASQPYFNRRYMAVSKAHDGHPPPEERLRQGYWGAILCPLGLLLMGLLSFKRVPWILPILASSLFGAGMIYSFNSTFTYLVDAYRPVAASALASNTFLRGLFAASFPLFGDQLYEGLGAVGGTCLLGGLMCLTAPLPFVFYKIGARMRRNSVCCDPH